MLSFCLDLFVIFYYILYLFIDCVCVPVNTHFYSLSPSNLGTLGTELRALGSEVSCFMAQSPHYPQVSD